MATDPKENPTSIQVHLTTGDGVDILWGDGHMSHYSFDYLRDACPCATCDARRNQSSGAELPLYRARMKPNRVSPVGFYALHFEWNDGHTTGIYSFRLLREICPCEECRAARKAR